MAKLLLNMRMVPEDEADEVRGFLRMHAIAFHETRPSRWGISYGGIWVSEDADYPQARRLMDDYQAARQARARAEHAQAVGDGSADTLPTCSAASRWGAGGTLGIVGPAAVHCGGDAGAAGT